MIHSIRKLATGLAFGVSLLAGSAHAEWLEATTKHFVVVGNTSEGDLRKRALRLEQFDAAMRFLVGGEEGVRVHLYLLDTMSDVQRLAGNSSIGGFYSASAQEAHAFMPMKITYMVQGFSAEGILFHEYTHHMLLGSTTSYVPGWATEGLAELFETARLGDDGSVTIGAASQREYEIKALHRWTVEEMLRKDSTKISSAESIERYSRGWALCHYLWMSGKRPGQYVEFIRLLNQSGDQVQAGRKAFGDLGKLNSELDAYIRKSSFNVSKLTADQIKPSTAITIRRMTAGESAMIQNRMISARGVDKAEAASLYARSRPIAMQYPADANVQTWFSEIALDAGELADADQAADRALADAPNTMMAMAFKGRVAARRAYDTHSAADWKLARSWFLRANRANPNDPYPFELFYDSFGAAGETPSTSAVTGMYRAVMLMPQDLSLRVRSGMELLRSGEAAHARVVLAPVAYNPHKDGDNPTMKLLEAIDSGADKDALMTKAGELKLASVNSLIPPKEGGAKKDDSGDSN
jgi:tetratricopeptide (TPR) repeat protein